MSGAQCMRRSRHFPVEHGRHTSGRQARPPQSARLQALSQPLLLAQRKLLGDDYISFVTAASAKLYAAIMPCQVPSCCTGSC